MMSLVVSLLSLSADTLAQLDVWKATSEPTFLWRRRATLLSPRWPSWRWQPALWHLWLRW